MGSNARKVFSSYLCIYSFFIFLSFFFFFFFWNSTKYKEQKLSENGKLEFDCLINCMFFTITVEHTEMNMKVCERLCNKAVAF